MPDVHDSPEEKSSGFFSDDVIAILVGITVLLIALFVTSQFGERVISEEGKLSIVSPIKGWLDKPGGWESNPLVAFIGTSDKPKSTYWGIAGFTICIGGLFTLIATWMKPKANPVFFLIGFLFLLLLGVSAYILAGQTVIKYYNLAYAIWALLVGLIIGNTIGKDSFGKVGQAAFRTELYIKTGLVIFGAEVLFSRLLNLGMPGILIAWVVTPIVLITTFWFGQKVLKIKSPSLNMVISADMSVCGVSAAIATAAACKAKKEELSVAIGLSLCFTAVMMVVLPAFIKMIGIGEVIGGAWIGGTVDATGAVAVAGELLGDRALEVAATIKMIQNILIGVIAFGVAAYWTTLDSNEDGSKKSKPQLIEIWHRFPKFVLGFIGASIVFSLIYSFAPEGKETVSAVISQTKILRGWLFCLAFVCIGIELNFRQLASQFSGGKPLILYICGQSLNLILTLLMSILAFKFLFPGVADEIIK